jgi:hypothetical protein
MGKVCINGWVARLDNWSLGLYGANLTLQMTHQLLCFCKKG